MEALLHQILNKLDSLEQGQKNIEQGQKNIEQGQKALEKRQETLEKRQETLENRQEALEKRQEALEHGQIELRQNQARMEFSLTERINAIAEAQKVTNEKLDNHINETRDNFVFLTQTLDYIVHKIDAHENQIKVLNATTADKRRLKS